MARPAILLLLTALTLSAHAADEPQPVMATESTTPPAPVTPAATTAAAPSAPATQAATPTASTVAPAPAPKSGGETVPTPAAKPKTSSGRTLLEKAHALKDPKIEAFISEYQSQPDFDRKLQIEMNRRKDARAAAPVRKPPPVVPQSTGSRAEVLPPPAPRPRGEVPAPLVGDPNLDKDGAGLPPCLTGDCGAQVLSPGQARNVRDARAAVAPPPPDDDPYPPDAGPPPVGGPPPPAAAYPVDPGPPPAPAGGLFGSSGLFSASNLLLFGGGVLAGAILAKALGGNNNAMSPFGMNGMGGPFGLNGPQFMPPFGPRPPPGFLSRLNQPQMPWWMRSQGNHGNAPAYIIPGNGWASTLSPGSGYGYQGYFGGSGLLGGGLTGASPIYTGGGGGAWAQPAPIVRPFPGPIPGR